ncbi:hypothetical protein [Streptomyces sp. NPDC006285]|uniref:hypothetical protein n=1 Tax=Streptomyces sp. NPDC006285 TaxID=3364742 RepID=UPI003679CB06
MTVILLTVPRGSTTFSSSPNPQAAPHRLGLLRLQGIDPVQGDHDGGDLVGPRVLATQRLHHGVLLPGGVDGPVLVQTVDLFAQRRHPGAHIVHAPP